MRALSFIGLGLVLIGIGLVYRRLLARRPSDAEVHREMVQEETDTA